MRRAWKRRGVQKQTINETEIRVIGMSRSGSHAVINWILCQWRGRCCYLNCAEPGTNPFVTARPLEEHTRWRANYDLDYEAELAGRFSRKDLLIYNYEDTFLGPLSRPDIERRHDEYVGRSAQRIDVLVLRDPFNLFASRIKSGYGSVSHDTALRIWKQHAAEFIKSRSRLSVNPRVLINFNRWSSDAQYRERAAESLGIDFTDAGFETVPLVARGSSFDGVRFNGYASRMPVNSRWRHFAEDQDYVRLFDARTVELSESVFGEVCRVEVRLRPAPPHDAYRADDPAA
jgi:hypothetical protein